MHKHTCLQSLQHATIDRGNSFANSKADFHLRLRKQKEPKKNKKDGGGREIMTLMSSCILGAGIEAAGSYL